MYDTVHDHVSSAVKLHRVNIEALPDYWADDDCNHFRTGLNAGFGRDSPTYCTWAADKSGEEEQEDDSDNDYALDDTNSDEEEGADERIHDEGERVSKRELVCHLCSEDAALQLTT
jgi:cobalamin biosynthesis protein CobT